MAGYRIKKYAWLPKYVNTWRPQGTKAIIWLQSYFETYEDTANAFKSKLINKYCNYLGFWSYEFWYL